MSVEMPASPAISATPTSETQVVHSTAVACDGGVGPLGHPLVYLSFGHGRETECPYCSKKFVLAEGVKAGHGH